MEYIKDMKIEKQKNKIIELEREVKRLTKACLDFDKIAEEERKINKELHKQLEAYGDFRD
jgi:hypothetical protein